MKNSYSYFSYILFFVFGSIFLSSCEPWNLEQKTFPKCTSPSASIIVKSNQGLSIKLSLNNPTGTIDKVTWNIDNGKLIQTSNEISFTFASPGLYTIIAELSNQCGDVYATQTQIRVSEIYPTTLNPESFGSNSISFLMTVNGSTNINSIIKYGICYSSVNAVPIIENSQTIFKSTVPTLNTIYNFYSNDLKDNTKYYFRSFVTTISGITIYGDILTATTSIYSSGLSTKASPPITGIDGAVSFAIGDKIYTCLGKDGTGNLITDLFEYNTITENWTKRASFPSNGRTRASVFVIDNVAYVGLGYKGGASSQVNVFPIYNEVSDFWKYNPSTDTWSQIASFPAGSRASACGFSLNNKGYIVGGGYSKNSGNTKYGYFKDTWEYDPQTNTWTQKANFIGGEFSELYGTTILGKAYIGLGQILDPQTGTSTGIGKLTTDLWEYNPLTNVWIKSTSFPLQGTYTAYPKIAFNIQNKAYFVFFKSNKITSIYVFNPTAGLTILDYTSNIEERFNGISASTASSGFFGLGAKFGLIYNDFYRFNP